MFEYEDKQIKYSILQFLSEKLNIFHNYFYDHCSQTEKSWCTRIMLPIANFFKFRHLTVFIKTETFSGLPVDFECNGSPLLIDYE